MAAQDKHKDITGYSFASFAAQTFFLSVISSALYVVISVITARALGPGGKGLLTVVILYPTLLFTVGHLSIYRAITVYVAEKKFRLSEYPGSSLVFVSVSSVVLTGVFLFFYYNSNEYFSNKADLGLIIPALGIVPCSMIIQDFTSILQANGRIKEFNLSRFCLVFSILLFISLTLLVFGAGVKGAVYAYLSANLVTAATVLYFVRDMIGEKWRVNLKLIIELIKDGLKLHIGVIAAFVFLKIDMLMLAHYRQMDNVGHYSVAVAMAGILALIPTTTRTVFYSKIQNMISDKDDMVKKTILVYKHTFYLLLAAVLLMAVTAKWLIAFVYGVAFLPALMPFMILLPGVYFLWQNDILANFLVSTRNFIAISAVAILGSLLNIVLNVMLIPGHGANGAAAASLITYVFIGGAYMGLFIRRSNRTFKSLILSIAFKKEDLGLYGALLNTVRNRLKIRRR
jgi:O-antigen/teichoic acid export membrane protein